MHRVGAQRGERAAQSRQQKAAPASPALGFLLPTCVWVCLCVHRYGCVHMCMGLGVCLCGCSEACRVKVDPSRVHRPLA